MRKLLVIPLVALVCSPLLAADRKFILYDANTTIKFVGTKPGGKHDGGFKKVRGEVGATGTDVTKLQISVDIDTTSLWADDPKLTGHLKSPDFFDVKRNPSARFVSTKIAKGDAGNYNVSGDLTLNGKKKSITFPAKISLATDKLILDASFKINRHDFGISYGKGKIDDDVSVTVEVNKGK
jgi:polyisoprenoid-binding protein YceI